VQREGGGGYLTAASRLSATRVSLKAKKKAVLKIGEEGLTRSKRRFAPEGGGDSFWIASFKFATLSNIMNVATPRLLAFKKATHFCAASVESTTTWSSAPPHAAPTAASKAASIAPRSPRRP
jgi:hypothetical protein